MREYERVWEFLLGVLWGGWGLVGGGGVHGGVDPGVSSHTENEITQ